MGREEAEAARRVIESKQLFRYRGGEGGETDQFEAEWAQYIGTAHALAVTSGTAALTCALVGIGIGPGDEVIVPAYTWIATPMAVLAAGGIPILAEVDDSLRLDPADAESKITRRTKAIIPVHMCGLPCNMDAILALARQHGLLVVEDACQADGGSYKGRRLGSLGLAGAHSFNQFKVITCGEGGAVVTSDQRVYERALIHHDVGAAFREHAEPLAEPVFAGLNFRMNEILSAVLRVQLTRLPGLLDTLRAQKRTMMDALKDEPAFTFNPGHDPEGDCASVLPLLFENASFARGFIRGMQDEGIDVGSPIDSGRHVYSNWGPILEKRGAHHPAIDPFNRCGYVVAYARDMCPRTLEYLARTVYVDTRIDRAPAELTELIHAIQRVARRKLSGTAK